jgi:hypothetical protein
MDRGEVMGAGATGCCRAGAWACIGRAAGPEDVRACSARLNDSGTIPEIQLVITRGAITICGSPKVPTHAADVARGRGV